MGFTFNPFTGSLDATGAQGNSFETMQTPLGTSPVADSSTDTLTLSNSDSKIGISGNSSTDTIDFYLRGFTEGSVPFGASSESLNIDATKLFWDNTSKSLGIQTNTPQAPLHVNASVGAQINSVTTASVSTTTESLNTSPTGSITLIPEFSTPSGSSTSSNTSGSGYVASGQTIDYRIYPVIYSAETSNYYASSNYDTAFYTDVLNDSSNFSVIISFPTAETEQTHWAIEVQVNGGGYNSLALHAVGTTYEDTNPGGSGPSWAGWPTQYTLNYTTPTAGSSASAQEANIGSGNLTENGTTYSYEIRSLANVGGIYYADQNSVTGSPLADNNMSNTFDLQVDWTIGTGDDQVIRISTDGGSNWTYHFVGNMTGQFYYTGQSTDTTAEDAWNRDVSGAEIVYAFKAFAKTTSPSGNVVYNASADQYTATITTPNIYYIFKHTLTGSIPNGAKIIANYNSGVTNSFSTYSSTLVDAGYSSWSTDITLTPNHYGFNNSTRYFKLVGYNGAIYSPTPLVVNATTSGYQYFTGTFSYPSGVTTVKILVSSDGVTYTGSKSFSSPTGTFSYDALSSDWGGNTTISPTASVPTGTRIDRAQSTLSDAPTLSLIEATGSGTRYSSLGFGYAANTSTTATIQSVITGAVSTGYIHIGSTRLIGFTNKNQDTEAWRLGNDYSFNLNKSTSAHFSVWGGNGDTVPYIYGYAAGDSNRGTTYFGTTTTSYGGGSKVVVSSAAGGTTLLHLRAHATGLDTIHALLVDNAGTYVAGISKTGRMHLNATAPNSATYLLIGGSSGSSQIRLEGQSYAATTDGDIWHDSTYKLFNYYMGGNRHFMPGRLFTSTSSATVANTTTETSLVGSGVGSNVLSNNYLTVGKTIKIKAWGRLSSVSSANLTMKVKFGSTVICASASHATHNKTNAEWRLEAQITCRSTGSSGTVWGNALWWDEDDMNPMGNTATVSINTTTTQTITISATWGTSSSNNSISCDQFSIEVT